MDASEQRRIDEMYMRRCIQLARNGEVGAPPNPMVGAVIVCDGRIIGEGYHRRCGGPHAEVNAVASVSDESLLSRSTIYVSLEPCAHYGKTPPCADLIVSRRIPRVVVGCRDPFAKVDGLGIKKLRDAGAEVVVGVLEEECIALNPRFMTFHTLHRPFITMKWAESADSFIDRRRHSLADGPAFVFSTPTSQALVHRLRATHQAILVGARTALLDNPSLTTRFWPGSNPLRLVLDLHASLPHDLRLFTDGLPTRVYTYAATPSLKASPSLSLVSLDASLPLLPQLMADLHQLGIQSLLVEGGRTTAQLFIDAHLWDEAFVEQSADVLLNGVPAPRLSQERLLSSRQVEGNTIRHFARISS